SKSKANSLSRELYLGLVQGLRPSLLRPALSITFSSRSALPKYPHVRSRHALSGNHRTAQSANRTIEEKPIAVQSLRAQSEDCERSQFAGRRSHESEPPPLRLLANPTGFPAGLFFGLMD